MKVKELIALLSQFDPERNVWVVYDQFEAFPPTFWPMQEDDAKMAVNYCGEEDEQPVAGDLATYAG